MAEATETRGIRCHRPCAGWCNRAAMVLGLVCAVGFLCIACGTWRFLCDYRYALKITNAQVSDQLRVVRSVAFAEYGDRTLELDLFLPSVTACSAVPCRLIVHLHGGGWVTGIRSAGVAVLEIEALVASGYAVASIDYRLAPQDRFPAALGDLERALDHLHLYAEQYGYVADRVGLLGSSAGAHLVLLYALSVSSESAAQSEDRPDRIDAGATVSAVVGMFGPTDLPEYLRGVRKLLTRRVFGVSKTSDPAVRQASPIHHASGSAPPVLLVHGDRDRLVAPAQSDALLARLHEVGAQARLLSVSGAGHSFRPVARRPMEPDRSGITAAVVEFFGLHLLAAAR